MREIGDQIAAIAAEAGQLAMDRWDSFTQWEKGPNNPVSDVDLEVDALLHQRLTALLPEAGWLSEETADTAERLGQRKLWVVDPIDGTRDYIRHRTGWAVSIALIEDGQPRYGVLDAPARGERWYAEAGKGAWRNGQRLHVGTCTAMAGARVSAEQLPKIDADLVMVERPNSIALRIAMVAADEVDVLATIRWGNEWDIAAAVLIAREAGATVTNVFGESLRFNTPDAEAFGVLASSPALHPLAQARLHDRAIAAFSVKRA